MSVRVGSYSREYLHTCLSVSISLFAEKYDFSMSSLQVRSKRKSGDQSDLH